MNTLCGYVTEHAAYHHGDASLNATIVGLAQTFVGSNNINLLHPAGQFGTRLQGGKDAASSRYISTKLTSAAKALFPAADDPLLHYLDEEGKSIEPQWYCPVIPMILVNGGDGIGTGWSTSVPCYNPRDIVKCLRKMIRGDEPDFLHPWYRGFKGTIIPVGNSKSYDVHGTLMKCEEDLTLRVKELPIGTWTSPYKEFLESHAIGHADASKKPFIKDILDNGTENDVCFTVMTTQEGYKQLETGGFYKKLKLSGSIATSNMVLFDSQGRLRRYDDTREMLVEFFSMRLNVYQKRKVFILNEMRHEALKFDNRARFIKMVIAGQLKIGNRAKNELIQDLRKNKFDEIFPKSKSSSENNEDSEDEEQGSNSGKGYDYLLSMPLWSLTKEKVEKLRNDLAKKKEEIVELEATSPEQLWESDLKNVENVLDENEKASAKHEADLIKLSKAAKKKQNSKGKGRKKTKVVYTETDLANDELIAPPEARIVAARKPRKVKAQPKEAVLKKKSKPPKAPVRRSILKSEDEDEVEMVFDDDKSEDDFMADEVLPKRAPTIRRAASRAKSSISKKEELVFEDENEESGEEFSDNDDVFVVETKPKAKSKRAPRSKKVVNLDDEEVMESKSITLTKESPRTSTQATKILDSEDENSSNDESNMSLADRLAQRLAINSPEAEVVKRAPVGRKATEKLAARKAAAPKRAASKAKSLIIDDSSSPEKTDESTSSGGTKRVRGARGAAAIGLSPSVARKVKRSRVKTKTPKKAVPKRPTKRAIVEDDEDEISAAPSPAVRRRPQRARKAVVVISSDEDDDFVDDESDFQASDDDSDFE